MNSKKSMALSELNFINCLGTYIMSICNYYLKNDAILKYLSLCTIECINLDLEQVKTEYDNNPWGYQILKLRDTENEGLFNNSSFSRFLHYIDDMLNIKVKKINNRTENSIIYLLNEMKNDNKLIIEIDEFYIKHNIKYYQKAHNPHAILIDSICDEGNSISVFDTEFNDKYTVSFNELNSAFNSETYNSILYIFDCKNAHVTQEIMDSNKKGTTIFIKPFVEFFEVVENTDIAGDDGTLIFHGYLFSILYKIMPYFQMMLKTNCFFERNDRDIIIAKCENINYNIKRLSMIMLKNIYNKKYSFNNIREFVVEIKISLIDFETSLI